MKLTMKQKVFSLKERFFIYDENGHDVYQVVGKILSLGHKLTILDRDDQEVGYIHQKLLSLTPKYFIQLPGQEEVELKGHVSLLRDHYTLKAPGGDWEIRGDFLSHEYEMIQRGQVVASVTRKFFSWGDTDLLDISPVASPLLALSVMLAIDCVMSDTTRNASTHVNN